MEIIPIAQYISKKRDVALKRRKLAKMLRQNTKYLAQTMDGAKPKKKPSAKVYRISDDTAQIRLRLKNRPLEVAQGKYAFRVAPSDGQTIEEATLEALRVIRERTLAGDFDKGIDRILTEVLKSGDKPTKAQKKRAKRSEAKSDELALAV